MIDFVKDLQETKAEEALEKLQQLFKIGKEASRLVEEWLELPETSSSRNKAARQSVVASDSFSSKRRSGTRILIPLCRGVKSNTTRNALHDKTNDFAGSVDD